MQFQEYAELAKRTAAYPNIGKNITYPTLGLVGEAGEVAEKVKKMFRDDNGMMTDERRQAIVKELGDVLWYMCAIANELNIPFEDIPKMNIAKLAARVERRTIHGDGDDR